MILIFEFMEERSIVVLRGVECGVYLRFEILLVRYRMDVMLVECKRNGEWMSLF